MKSVITSKEYANVAEEASSVMNDLVSLKADFAKLNESILDLGLPIKRLDNETEMAFLLRVSVLATELKNDLIKTEEVADLTAMSEGTNVRRAPRSFIGKNMGKLATFFG